MTTQTTHQKMVRFERLLPVPAHQTYPAYQTYRTWLEPGLVRPRMAPATWSAEPGSEGAVITLWQVLATTIPTWEVTR